MPTEIRNTDAEARLVLPKTFANAKVIIEHVSETVILVLSKNFQQSNDTI